MKRPLEFTFLSDDEQDPKYRLRIEEEEGLITIAEELLTSRSQTAAVTSVRAAIDLTGTQALWLHASLGELLAARGLVP